MPVSVGEIAQGMYPRYGEIDPSFEVTSALRVVPRDSGLGGLEFLEEAVAPSYRKGADGPGDSPSSWPPRAEPGEFAAFLAEEDAVPVGGAAVIVNPSGAFLFERRDTLAGLWDIRVAPQHRGRGIGTQLLLHAAEWARSRGCTQLRAECQNVNVAACRFYAAHCTLGGVERFGYAACADVAYETMLLWYRDLSRRGRNARTRGGDT